VDIPQQHDQNSVAEVDNIEAEEHGKAHNQIESEEILGNDDVRHEESVDQRFEENIFSNEEAVQESIEASPSHKEYTNTSREGDQVFEAQDEAAIKEQPKNLEDGTPIIDSISADEVRTLMLFLPQLLVHQQHICIRKKLKSKFIL